MLISERIKEIESIIADTGIEITNLAEYRQSNDDILSELKQQLKEQKHCAMLGQVRKVSPYAVPNGYLKYDIDQGHVQYIKASENLLF